MIAALLLVAGTALAGPPPAVPILEDAEWSVQGADASAPASEPWWAQLDPTLSALVEEGLQRNGDAASAWHAVRQSRARATQTGSTLLPSASATATLTRQAAAGGFFNIVGAAFDSPTGTGTGTFPPTGTGTGTGLPPDGATQATDPNATTSADLQLQAQWTLDLFGRNALSYAASRHEARAAEGDWSAAALSLAFAIGTAWLDLAASEERIARAKEQLEASEALLEVVELRYQRGDATGLDVLQQRQSIASSRTLVPQLELGRDLARHQLATLLGRAEGAELPQPMGLPELPPTPSIGTPAELVAHRPDLAAAVERRDGSRDRRTAAWMGFLPTVSASAAVGQNGFWYGDTEEPWTDTWSFGATASLPLFSGGALWAQVAEARHGAHIAQRSLDQLALGAKREVDDALASERSQARITEATEAQAEAARLAWESAREQYLQGVVPFVNVITAFQGHQQAEISVVQARRDLLAARIQLHDALGGPWTRTLPQPTGATP